jgi:hypothetical protein
MATCIHCIEQVVGKAVFLSIDCVDITSHRADPGCASVVVVWFVCVIYYCSGPMGTVLDSLTTRLALIALARASVPECIAEDGS